MGDSADNLHLDFHRNSVEQTFDWGMRRHLGNAQVNAWSPRAPHATWIRVVQAAREGEAQLTSVLLEIWPNWTNNHLVSRGLVDEARALILMVTGEAGSAPGAPTTPA